MEKENKPIKKFKFGEPTKLVTVRAPVSKVKEVREVVGKYLEQYVIKGYGSRKKN